MTVESSFKIIVSMQRRPDGGLRVWSDDVPGLVLSGDDATAVMADLKPAIEVIVSSMLGCEVAVQRLVSLPAASRKPAAPGLFARFRKTIGRVRSLELLEFSAAPCPAT